MRKKQVLISAAMTAAMLFTACAGKSETGSAARSDTSGVTEPTPAPRLATDSLAWADSLEMGGCKAVAKLSGRYPVAGVTHLVDSIRAWIGYRLSFGMQNLEKSMFTPTPSELASGTKLMARCGEAMLAQARANFKGFVEDSISTTYEYDYSFYPVYETDSLTTYSFSGYVYLGGAHGGALGTGQTFDNNTGRRLTAADIFLPDKRKELIGLLKQELWNQYFKQDAAPGTTLRDALLINPDTLSLPAFPPEFLANGLVFTYQQYEIACYAAGMPSCVIPYASIKPLMRPEAARLLPE